MTPEHKQQAKQLIADWTNVSRTSTPAVWFLNADCMAGFLHELVDAPGPEPFGYFKPEPFGWTDCAETDDGAIALYAAPPAPSVPDEIPDAVIDAVADAIGEAYDCLRVWSAWGYGTMRPDDFLPVTDDAERVAEIARAALSSWLAAAPTPAEAPADVARDAERWRTLPQFLEEFQIPYLRLIEKIDAAIERQGGE